MTPYVLFDTEFTTSKAAYPKWNETGQHQEIIQIAAARIIPGQPWASFRTLNVLVKPVINPTLDPYCIDLTGITQAKLDAEGLTMGVASYQLHRFMDGLPAFSNGQDVNKIAQTCGLQGIKAPLDWRRFGSIRNGMYGALERYHTFRREDYPSGKLHELVGIPLPDGMGRVHDALRDVWSLHVTLEWLAERGHAIIDDEIPRLLRPV